MNKIVGLFNCPSSQTTLTRKDTASDSASATIVKPSHESGIRHQSGYAWGEKPAMRLATRGKGS